MPEGFLRLDDLRDRQHSAWQRRERLLVESLIAGITPALVDNELLELIYAEVMLRAEMGETCQVDEYIQRFPKFTESLRRLFAVHQALESPASRPHDRAESRSSDRNLLFGILALQMDFIGRDALIDALRHVPESARGDSQLVALFDRVEALLGAPSTAADEPWFPRVPEQLEETGLAASDIERLILKFLLARGSATGRTVAQQTRLTFGIIDPLLRGLKYDQLLSFVGTAEMGDYEYAITEMGRERARRYVEECTYFLSLPSGKKIQVPFDQLIIFSTNLEPRDLVDGAFLRRIPYKIQVPDPTEAEFREIIRRLSPRMGFQYDDASVDHLIQKHYHAVARPFRSCQPRDLLQQVRNYCTYKQQPRRMTPAAFDFAVANYFSVL